MGVYIDHGLSTSCCITAIQDTSDGAAPALVTSMPDSPAVESTEALTVGVERQRPRLLGLPAPAEAMYG